MSEQTLTRAAVVTGGMRLSRVMPALFTRISTRPKAAAAASNSALQPAAVETSACTATASAPAALHSATVSAAAASPWQ